MSDREIVNLRFARDSGVGVADTGLECSLECSRRNMTDLEDRKLERNREGERMFSVFTLLEVKFTAYDIRSILSKLLLLLCTIFA